MTVRGHVFDLMLLLVITALAGACAKAPPQALGTLEYDRITLPSPADNLALDEALLENAEAERGPSRVLRLWESPHWAVVLGRSSRHGLETHAAACVARHVPVLRRASGGGTVVIGPGCLVYTDDFHFHGITSF